MSGLLHEAASVVKQKEIASSIYDMWIETSIAKSAKAGQFINVYPKSERTLLPRPISICEVDKDNNRIRIVYRVVGAGTKEFSKYVEGDAIRVLGPIGNGFPVEIINENLRDKNIALLGGGIGIPPMLETLKSLKGDVIAVLGYRDCTTFLLDEFKQYGEAYCASEDGSVGVKGNVLDVIKSEKLKVDVILACGPMPMLRAIKKYAEDNNIEAYISLEERMACGVGACLGCITETENVDHHSYVKNARVCTEGPVFEANKVVI